jgi:excisionase family DNA binding protein
LDVSALAKRLSVPERHVRRLVAENRVPYLKWGHLVRFDPRQIERWLEAAQVQPAAVPFARGGRAPRPGLRLDDDPTSIGIRGAVNNQLPDRRR